MASPITVYSQNGCIGCKATERFLTKHGAQFEVIDITDNDSERDHVLDIMSENNLENRMPLVLAGDKKWSGFRDDKLTEALMSA